jgi:hypothetical protein
MNADIRRVSRTHSAVRMKPGSLRTLLPLLREYLSLEAAFDLERALIGTSRLPRLCAARKRKLRTMRKRLQVLRERLAAFVEKDNI